MYVDAPLIAISARKHGVRDHDMIHAFNHPILVDDLEEGLTMFVSADQGGNLLEVGISTAATARSSFMLCPPNRST